MVRPKKVRSLKELYNATQIIPLLKINPVLAGSFQMQGPDDEVDNYNLTNTNTVFFQADKGVRSPSKNEKLHLRIEPGICDVCAAPCLSCFHVKRDPMEKENSFSNKPYRGNTLSYLVNDTATVVKSRACEKEQHTTSEASILVSLSSRDHSFPEDAEHKVNMRTSDVFCTSEAVEVYPKLSSGGDFRIENYSLKANCHTNKTNHKNKFDDCRGIEGHDDNISCVSGTNEPNGLPSSVIQNVVPCCSASTDSLLTEGCGKVVSLQAASESMDFKFDVEGSSYNSNRQINDNEVSTRRACPSSLSSELSSHHLILLENPSSDEADDDIQLENIASKFSDGPCGKFLADSTSKNLVGESCSHPHAEYPGCDGDHLGRDMERSSLYSFDEIENIKVSLSGGNQRKMNVCKKKEVGANTDGGYLLEEPSKPPEECLATEVGDFPAKSDAKEASLQSHHVDDSDESDLVEHDVKVCDICGDAGRDDLLAICCRCIDGAEHTYCMREMLDKVPEGDWLCEECKLDEENKIMNQQKYSTVAGYGKDQYSGKADAGSTELFMKPGRESSDIEGTRSRKDLSVAKVSGKRRAEESEISSAVKKQALDIITGSPRTCSPSRLRALSFDSSLTDIPDFARCPTTGPRSQTSRGAFFKSNSFNSRNIKPRTKLVDEVVLQKQKSVEESASHNKKVVRGIGKSISFTTMNSGRFGASESKVKMLSPKFSHVQDHKILKNKSERNFERKNSLKSSSIVGNLTSYGSTASTPKVDKKLVSRGEPFASSSDCNHEVKLLKGNSKLFAGTKSTIRATIVGAEVPVSIVGDAKKQLPHSPHGVGTASSNGVVSSVERKPVHSTLKDDNSSKFTSSKESASLAEGIKEGSTSHLRPSIILGAPAIPCQKCKQPAHSAQACTVGIPGIFGLDKSAERRSKEVINRGNKLKDAIQAAVLKKPGICRKNRIVNQSDRSSALSMDNEVASQDHVPNSSNVGNFASAEMVLDGPGRTSPNSCVDYVKQSNGNTFKQFMLLPTEGITSRIDDSTLVVPFDRRHSITELSNHDAMALSAPSKIPAIPDHECIWQGGFEVNRSGMLARFWDGLQAHLSTSASSRVFEAVNKFSHKIHLNEVSRLNAWPVQFENSGVKEDNIALYFFAKDIESYERSYQVLLEDMMRGDLALIGSIDDVELLIFPSNQLPERSHCWNMLFYLWGVFRGKKKNSSEQLPSSPETSCVPRVLSSIPTDKVSFPEDTCSLESLDKKKITFDRASTVEPEAPALVDLHVSSMQSTNGGRDCDTKVLSLFQESNSSRLKMEQQEREPHPNLSCRQESPGRSCPEMKCICTPMDGQVDSEYRCDLKSQASLQKMTMASMCTSLDRVNKVAASSGEMVSFGDANEENPTVPNGMNSSRGVVNSNENLKVERGSFAKRVLGKELQGLQCEPRKRPCIDLSEDVGFTGANQIRMWLDVNSPMVDDGSVNKKQKSHLYGVENHDTSSALKEKLFEEPLEETAVSNPINNNGERYFFPVDPTCQAKGVVFGERVIPLIGLSSSANEQDRYNEIRRIPNLELALGAELNPPFHQENLQCLDGNIDKRTIINTKDQVLDKLEPIEKEEDDVSASLSLSLSFSYAGKDKDDKAVQAVQRTGQLMLGNQHLAPSMLLFGDVPNE